ncbi:hypothetical protein N7474_003360 [Penicillium riverlandense]|uniref:uncharacterized protein n=1 Tax=Penicillium riverlandense TaxID=1903569 RepID=UPI002547DC37|nr:uncharacterized protein N7474_003360 [Penicillium riverlandense]KAJ5826222.1 hypothetical protein N7474_003360 [Penicillium riverlandense]
MSRNFVPAALSIGVGIFTEPPSTKIGTGYYIFQPAIRELEAEKSKTHQSPPAQAPASQSSPVQSPPSASDNKK